MNQIPMPKQPTPDPYHAFLCCPKCKERKLRTVFLNENERVGGGKKDKHTLICDGCGFDLGKDKAPKKRKKKAVDCPIKF